MGEQVIVLTDLTKQYGNFTAVDHIRLNIRKGEIFGLLGPNGAGKSTTILMMLGLTEPTSGTVEICGINSTTHPIEVKRKIGYLPEDVGFYDDMTGPENLIYTARLNGISDKEAKTKAMELMKRVGLEDQLAKKTGKYSRGMRQRLGLADVLIKNPEIIILDEPTSGIDPAGVQEFIELIRWLSKEEGLTVLFSSHHLKMQAGPSLNASLDWTLFMLTSTIILAAGSMFILWLGERITDKGIGNGISLIIMVGIIARLPQSLFQELISRMTDKTGGLVMFLIELVVLLLVIAFAILLVQGTRKIPVQYAKKIVGNKQYGGARQYIPLKVNAANVMPIIFAQAIMFIPITLVGFSNVNNASGFIHALTDHTSFWYNLIFAVLIILFTYFYTAITINPTQMAEDMKRNNGFIPGIKPGKKTAEYIDDIMSRITLPGSFFLALVAIMPAFAGIFGVQAGFAQFFGGTSLLILVGVVLDTLQQVESHLLMRHYDGLLKSGRIKGRAGVAAY